MDTREHPYLMKLRENFAEGRIDRREFLRTSTLLGLSATAAYAFVDGGEVARTARADRKTGGTIKIAHRVQEIESPHTYAWFQSNITRQVCEYLTRTGADNITRPWLVSSWDASEDLRTWTLHLRQGVTWRNGRAFTADDVIWNLQHVLDPATGSSVLGLMKGYMMNDDSSGLWDANAIEKVDDHTVRLNTRAPQLAVPEHLFHYPLHILDPEEGGVFGIGSNGTGAFELVEYEVGVTATNRAREGYWNEGPWVETLQYVDLGDDPSALLGAMQSQQVDGAYEIDTALVDTFEQMGHVQIYEATTAQTAVVRGRSDSPPFDDPRVLRAIRLATDPSAVLSIALQGRGMPAEHHHVCPIHPEYAQLPVIERDVEAARALLAEAGYPDGIDLSLDCKNNPAWEPAAVQVMVEQWKEAGIRCAINIMPGASYWDVWDKTPFGFTQWTHRPLGVMVLGLAYRSGVPWNESAFSNAEFDSLLNEAEGLIDVEARREVMAKLETLMQEIGPIVQPAWRSQFTAYHTKVKGFQMHPTSYIFGEELWIDA